MRALGYIGSDKRLEQVIRGLVWDAAPRTSLVNPRGAASQVRVG